MNKKASIQISVNFLVIMVISIVIISLGFFLINRMVGQGDTQIGTMDDRLRNEIENLIVRENKIVAIPVVEKEIDRGKADFFGIGVMNLETQPQFYKLNVTFDKAYDRRTGNEINGGLGSDPEQWIRLEMPAKINARDKYVFTVGFAVPRTSSSGLYIFNVSVTNSTLSNPNIDCFNDVNTCYDKSLHKLYLLVN